MNLLITGAWSGAEERIPVLSSYGHSIAFMQNEADILPKPPEWVEGVICNGLFLSHKIEKFINLKYIQLTSVGFDRVPMDYIESHGIEIHNARGVYSIPMAEFAICGVLQLYKQSCFFTQNQNNCRWEKNRGLLELYGKKVCIVGCGSVGTECAKRFSAFGCTVVGIDPYLQQSVQYQKIYSLACLNTILPTADILVLTVPLTAETHHMIGRERLSLLKESAVLVNIARGAVVDTEALIEALPHMGGAVLDVFEDEPLATDSPLWNTENVIITPHNSYAGDGNNDRLASLIIGNLKGKSA